MNIDMKLIDVRMKKLFFLIRIYEELQKSDLYSACWCTTIWHKMHMTAGNIIKETSTIIIIIILMMMMIKELVLGRCEEFECLFSSLDETLLFAEDDEEFVPQLGVKFPPQTV